MTGLGQALELKFLRWGGGGGILCLFYWCKGMAINNRCTCGEGTNY